MLANTISRPRDDPVALVLRLCERSEPRIAGRFSEEFPAAASWLMEAGALRQGSPVRGLSIDDDFEGPPIEVTWRPETSSHASLSRTGCWVDAPPEHLLYYVLDLAWLLRELGAAVGIAGRIPPHVLVEGILWDLGDAWLGRRKATILFGRRLDVVSNLDAAHDALTKRVGRPPGVLLTTSRGLSRHLSLPGGHRVLALHDCMVRGTSEFRLDLAILEGALSDSGSGAADPLRASADFGTIRVRDRMFVFRGSRQRQVVQYLYEQWQRGQHRVSVSMMWTELELSSGTRLRDLFKGHPDWQDLIAYEQGLCWLRV